MATEPIEKGPATNLSRGRPLAFQAKTLLPGKSRIRRLFPPIVIGRISARRSLRCDDRFFDRLAPEPRRHAIEFIAYLLADGLREMAHRQVANQAEDRTDSQSLQAVEFLSEPSAGFLPLRLGFDGGRRNRLPE